VHPVESVVAKGLTRSRGDWGSLDELRYRWLEQHVRGEEALRQARTGAPDLILLDLLLPKLTGFEVLRRLKQDPVTAATPVLMVSNLGQDSDIRQARAAGAIDYLVKAELPLDEEDR
jgi:CheY-like chemotaxis protein